MLTGTVSLVQEKPSSSSSHLISNVSNVFSNGNILLVLSEFLTDKDIVRSRVSHQMLNVFSSDIVWESRCKRLGYRNDRGNGVRHRGRAAFKKWMDIYISRLCVECKEAGRFSIDLNYGTMGRSSQHIYWLCFHCFDHVHATATNTARKTSCLPHLKTGISDGKSLRLKLFDRIPFKTTKRKKIQGI